MGIKRWVFTKGDGVHPCTDCMSAPSKNPEKLTERMTLGEVDMPRPDPALQLRLGRAPLYRSAFRAPSSGPTDLRIPAPLPSPVLATSLLRYFATAHAYLRHTTGTASPRLRLNLVRAEACPLGKFLRREYISTHGRTRPGGG